MPLRGGTHPHTSSAARHLACAQESAVEFPLRKGAAFPPFRRDSEDNLLPNTHSQSAVESGRKFTLVAFETMEFTTVADPAGTPVMFGRAGKKLKFLNE